MKKKPHRKSTNIEKFRVHSEKQKLLWLAGFGGTIKNGGKMKLER